MLSSGSRHTCGCDADCDAGTCDDLVCGAKRFGVWGLGLIGNKTAYNNLLPAIHGYHFRFSWADYEPSASGFASPTTRLTRSGNDTRGVLIIPSLFAIAALTAARGAHSPPRAGCAAAAARSPRGR